MLLATLAALCVAAPAEHAAAQTAPGAPTGVSLTAAAGAFTVSWTAPANTGGSAITSYDVRSILNSASDKADANWDVESGISPSGTMQYVLTGLRDSTRYDVQVRAVNAARAGGWSSTARGNSLDHGSTRTGATLVTLDSTVPGRIDQETDADLFKFELMEAADVWIYTSGRVDTKGVLQNSAGGEITSNNDSEPGYVLSFSIRRALNMGTYYLRVTGVTLNARPIGNYDLRIRTVPDPGATAALASPIRVGGSYGGRVDSSSADDYFQLTVTEDSWVKLRALTTASIDLTPSVRDASDQEVYAYVIGHSHWARIHRGYISFEAVTFLTPGTYVIRVAEGSPGSGGPYVLQVGLSSEVQWLQQRCSRFPSLLGEPLSGCQWHLENTGDVQAGGAGMDINVKAAWATTKGEGVTVAVIDGGFEVDHPDLRENTLPALNHTPAGAFLDVRQSHATNLAGLIAARDNGFGMVGVAPRASIYGPNIVRAFPTSGDISARAAEGALLHLERTAVSNNSWGPADDGRPMLTSAVWEAAIERGLSEGFGRKGVVYVFAGGNGGDDDYSSISEFTSHYGVIAVCAVNYRDVRSPRSERGSNLWVCAPSNHEKSTLPGIATTANGGYSDSFGGTSASAALVSGVVALVRAANPALTWRDVKFILAASARKNDTTHSDWQQGALQYGSTRTRYHFNHTYGFGVVDAGAAVALASTWTAPPALRTLKVTSSATDQPIDQNTVTGTVAVEGDHIEFIEYVTVNLDLDLDHDKFRELSISLTSPSGATSWVARKTNEDLYLLFNPQELRDPIDLGSARHLGEDPEGTWTLSVHDPSAPDDGTLKGWGLTIHGHGRKPDRPPITSVGPGDTYLTVEWEAPEDIGASTITSYDLRYIRSDATDKADDHWTPKTGIWSGGDRVYELTGLTKDVGYDVQVRAVNSAGDGPWSEVSVGETRTVAPGAPAIDSVVAGDGTFTVSWSAPARNGGGAIIRYDVRHIRSDAADKADDHWDVEAAWSTGDGALQYTGSSISNTIEYDIEVRAANSAGDGAWSSTAMLRRNRPPEFPTTENGMRTVDENTPSGRAVGAPVAATDEESDTRTYSIAESGAAFSIDAGTGQLRTKDPLDREAPGGYTHTVTVEVSDGVDPRGNPSMATDTTIAVTITVSDVNEAPTAVDDEVDILEDEPVVVRVLDNDIDPDDGDTMTVRVRTPPRGTAQVESDGTITYTPKRDSTDTDRFSYEVRDSGGLTARAAVEVEITPVNDVPVFAGATPSRSIAESAGEGANVGAAVRATDADRDMLTYSLSGPDASSFEIHLASGQLTVGRGVVFDIGTKSEYAVTVGADDGNGGRVSVDVTITVTLPPTIGIGGGPVGPSGPTPSTEDFAWTVTRDIEALDAGHGSATGMWADGATLWLADNPDGGGDAIYAYDLESGARVPGNEFELANTNRAPRGLWSDRETAWVSDSGRDRLFAYDRGSGERVEEREFELAARNRDPRGIWADGATMWVLDGGKDALFAYDLASGELLGEYALTPANSDPRGLWSDRVTVWVSDDGAKRLFAYRLPVRPATPAADDADPLTLERVRAEEFTLLSRASNNSPRGLWSDGDVMYVADASDDKVYTYNMPDAIDARLASLTLSDIDIADGVTQTTVEAAAVQSGAAVVSDPPDADADTDGYQIALAGRRAITVTVTSADGSRIRVYRVRIAGGAADPLTLDLRAGGNLVVVPAGAATTAADLFGGTDVTRVWQYNRGTRAWDRSYLPRLGGGSFAIAGGDVLWVVAPRAQTLPVAGTPIPAPPAPGPITLDLRAGGDLVVVPAGMATTAADLFGGTDVTRVWKYNRATRAWDLSYLPRLDRSGFPIASGDVLWVVTPRAQTVGD